MDRSARIRRLALGCALLLVAFLSGRTAVAQGEFSCEDFLTHASAQMHLDNFPHDPYGLDPDGDGVACENMTSASSAPRADGDEVVSLPVAAAAYEIVREEFQHVNRPRVVLRVVVEPAGDEETAAALAAALEDGLANHDRALVAHVFAYNAGDDTDGAYTRGIAQGSRDGLGWTGNGRLNNPFDRAPDELGVATVVLDSSLDAREEVRLTVPLDLEGAAPARPQPAQVEQVAPTPDEVAYADAIAAQTTLLSEGMDTFSELLENPRIGQDDWTIQVAAVIVTWQLAEDEAIGMTVPPAFATFHESYLLSLRYLNMAGDDFIAGIDALDPSLIESANANIQLGVAALSVAQEELDRVLAERGVTSP